MIKRVRKKRQSKHKSIGRDIDIARTEGNDLGERVKDEYKSGNEEKRSLFFKPFRSSDIP